MNKISVPPSIPSIYILTYPLFSVYVYMAVFMKLGLELRDFHIPGKCPTNEPSPSTFECFCYESGLHLVVIHKLVWAFDLLTSASQIAKVIVLCHKAQSKISHV